MLQRVAAYCSVLQFVAGVAMPCAMLVVGKVCNSELQHVAVPWSLWRKSATVCCNVLHCVAVSF